jgi:adenylate cyclase
MKKPWQRWAVALFLSVSMGTVLPVWGNAVLLSEAELALAEIEGGIETIKKAQQLFSEAQKIRPQDSAQSREIAKQALKLLKDSHQIKTTADILDFMGELESSLGNQRSALEYHEQALSLWRELNDQARIAASLLNSGISYWHLSHYDKALQYCLDALKLFEQLKYTKGIADALHNIGIIHDLLFKYDSALEYHHQALNLRTEIGDHRGIADSLNNIGIIHYFQTEYDKALAYLNKAIIEWDLIGDSKGAAKTVTNVGLCYKELHQYDKALEAYVRALNTWEHLGDKYQTANLYNNIGEVHVLAGNYVKAKKILLQGYQMATEIEAKELIRENLERMSDYYLMRNEFQLALAYYKQAANLKAKIYTEESSQQIAEMQTKYETEKKEQEIALLVKNQEINALALERQTLLRNSLLGGLLMLFILAFIIYGRYRFSQRVNRQLADANALIQKEKEKSDQLLLNILPAQVAIDLKETGRTEPQLFENVTVYFSDVVGFTNLSSSLEPGLLIAELNEIFTAFDNIIERNGCERVKTIGDAYLCVCGMPVPNPNHAENMVRSALEIVDYMTERNRHSDIQWRIRIGIHTGKVVGGVVGVKKYIYDVFGDTINTASRMESNSEPMRINISEVTYHLVKDKFPITPRGLHAIKGKGEMAMYFVG